jgi:hypothetical protein
MLRFLLIALATIWGLSILVLVVAVVGARISSRMRRLLGGDDAP